MHQLPEHLLATLLDRKPYLIGICGIPGAGKSTLAFRLQTQLPHSILVPFDGFHKPKKELTAEQIKYRGALHTFDIPAFTSKIKELQTFRKAQMPFECLFPSFNHIDQDPKEDNIKVTRQHQYVIVEGLYIFMGDPSIKWDFKIWVDAEQQNTRHRLAHRHFQSGIVATLEEGYERVAFNDAQNGKIVLKFSDTKECLHVTM